MADGNLPEEEKKVDAADLAAALTFGPAWAREEPKNPYAGREDWGGGDEGRGGRDGGRRGGGERRGGGFGGGRGAGPRREGAGARREGPRGAGGERRGERREGAGGGERRERRPFVKREPVAPLKVKVSFLPNRDVLAKVVRDVQATQRAFPLIDIAKRFLAREDCHDVKLEGPAEAGAERVFLSQCQICRRVFRHRDAAEAHVLEAHLERYFDVSEEECEAPAGQYTCVARCRLSGVVLGPPNHHGYNEKLQELWATRFAHMPKSEYLGNIETVRDEALVEAWREEQKHRTVYRLKAEYAASAARAKGAEKKEGEGAPAEGAEGAEGGEAKAAEIPAWTRKEAQEWLRGQVKGLVREAARCLLPGTEARGFGDEALRLAVSRARTWEGRFPLTLTMALRPAFRHMKLHLFKINARETYVTAVEPKPVDLKTAPGVVKEIVGWIGEHEGSTRKSVLEGLRPGVDAEAAPAAEVLLHLGNLVATGGVIEFFDGKLGLPRSSGEVAAAETVTADAGDAAAEAAEAAAAPAEAEAAAAESAEAAEPAEAEAAAAAAAADASAAAPEAEALAAAEAAEAASAAEAEPEAAASGPAEPEASAGGESGAAE